MRKIVLVVHNVRSAHNVGSLLRSADGLGIDEVYLTGYTPYPAIKNDARMPHIAAKVNRRIEKTALGAEKTAKWQQSDDIDQLLRKLKERGYEIIALEQSPTSITLQNFHPSGDMALIVGSEVGGLPLPVLEVADKLVEIPMHGAKDSFNVSVAGAIALHHVRNLL